MGSITGADADAAGAGTRLKATDEKEVEFFKLGEGEVSASLIWGSAAGN